MEQMGWTGLIERKGQLGRPDGMSGTDGTDRTDGTEGMDGADRTDGRDGME